VICSFLGPDPLSLSTLTDSVHIPACAGTIEAVHALHNYLEVAVLLLSGSVTRPINVYCQALPVMYAIGSIEASPS
jgi:hypothetical protein